MREEGEGELGGEGEGGGRGERIQATSDENGLLRKELDESTRRNVELQREVKRLTAKFKSRMST